MKILVLDDNELLFTAPASYFIDPHDYRTDTVVQVCHPDAFWDQYETDIWDEVWIDHDLGNPKFSGRDVTKRYGEMAHAGRKFTEKIVIITMNPAVADNMGSDILSQSPGAKVTRCPISFLGDSGVSRGDPIRGLRTVLRRN